MTDDELEPFVGENVKIVYNGQTLAGKLIGSFAAQVKVQAPYAIEWTDFNDALGTNEVRVAAIHSAEAIQSIELVNEAKETKAEIEDAVEDAQTPG
ncbi:MAG: hypothetical protein JOZ77_12790 [Candidatus Eremiobacteraeota bacterium]|nr:hypothetical protein [Candidatus Eremiobacteraeota bacterium]